MWQPRWIRGNRRKATRLASRVCDMLSEIGILLLAFTPLEAGLSPEPIGEQLPFLWTFGGGGALLFSLGAALAWRLDV